MHSHPFRAAAIASALFVTAAGARANVRLDIPEDAQPPVYTSSAGPFRHADGSIFAIHDGQWAAIVFWRPTECVRTDFNLFHWADIPMPDGCPLVVEGFAIWPGDTPGGAPMISEARGTGAVPVWFVAWTELQAAGADGELTILELAAAPSLRTGTASFYHEQNHTSGVHPVSHLAVVARGQLASGGSFEVRAVEVGLELETVRIEFR